MNKFTDKLWKKAIWVFVIAPILGFAFADLLALVSFGEHIWSSL